MALTDILQLYSAMCMFGHQKCTCQCKEMQLYTVLFNVQLCMPCPVSARKCIPGQKCLRPAHSAGWQRQLLLIFLFPPPTSATLTSQCNASEIHFVQTFCSAHHFTIAYLTIYCRDIFAVSWRVKLSDITVFDYILSTTFFYFHEVINISVIYE